MNSKFRFALAAAVVLAITIPASWVLRSDSRNGVAFGQVIENVRAANSARLHLRIEQKGQPPRESTLYIQGKATRQEEANGRVFITDTSVGKSMMLTPDEHTAVVTTPTIPSNANANESAEQLDLIERLKALQEGAEVSLGTQTMAGQTAVGFQVNKNGVRWTIWADAKSRLPVRVEYHLPLFEATAIMTEFEFDLDLNPELFSLVPPAGYAVEERATEGVWVVTDPQGEPGEIQVGVGIDFSKPLEKDLLDYLRTSAEWSGGTFSYDLLNLPAQEAITTLKEGQGDEQAQATAKSLLLKYTRAIMYMQKLESEADRGKVWTVGVGVKLGDAEQAVVVWKPSNADQCRAIYGDLSVREINAEEFQRIQDWHKEQTSRSRREKGYLGLEVTSDVDRSRIMCRLNKTDEPPVIELKLGKDRCVVKSAIPGSAAEKAGLKEGDVIVSIDGRAVHSLSEFVMAVGKHKAGEKVKIVIRRGEQETTMEITLGEWPE